MHTPWLHERCLSLCGGAIQGQGPFLLVARLPSGDLLYLQSTAQASNTQTFNLQFQLFWNVGLLMNLEQIKPLPLNHVNSPSFLKNPNAFCLLLGIFSHINIEHASSEPSCCIEFTGFDIWLWLVQNYHWQGWAAKLIHCTISYTAWHWQALGSTSSKSLSLLGR